MKTTCIIDTYNQERFICEAIDSALSQEVLFDEILVVDDASTDGSREILNDRYGSNPNVKLIYRPVNGGQLACIQTGVLEATGDICCFLDGDDCFHEQYLQHVLEHYQSNPDSTCAYVTCKAFDQMVRRTFGKRGTQVTGITVGITLRGNTFVGAPTSCLSYRTDLLREIFPYPFLDDWIIRADDYLNGVSSILGAKKTFIDRELVHYRWHDQNNSWTMYKSLASYRRRLSLNRLRFYFAQNLTLDTESLNNELHREFATWANPSWQLLSWYLKAIFNGNQSFLRKIAQSASLLRHKLATVIKRSSHQAESLKHGKLLSSYGQCGNINEKI